MVDLSIYHSQRAEGEPNRYIALRGILRQSFSASIMAEHIGRMASDSGEGAVAQWLPSAVDRLVRTLDPERVVLFGSRARGTATRRSDIDLFLLWETDLSPLDRIGRVLALLKDAPKPVEAVVYTPGELERRARSPFIRRILQEGEVLYERGRAAA